MSLTSEPLESVGHVSGSLDQIKRWFRKTVGAAEERIDGGSPVATPPPDATSVGTGVLSAKHRRMRKPKAGQTSLGPVTPEAARHRSRHLGSLSLGPRGEYRLPARIGLEPAPTFEVDEEQREREEFGADAECDEATPTGDVAHFVAEGLAEEAGEPAERQKIVAMIVSCFITVLRRFDTVER